MFDRAALMYDLHRFWSCPKFDIRELRTTSTKNFEQCPKTQPGHSQTYLGDTKPLRSLRTTGREPVIKLRGGAFECLSSGIFSTPSFGACFSASITQVSIDHLSPVLGSSIIRSCRSNRPNANFWNSLRFANPYFAPAGPLQLLVISSVLPVSPSIDASKSIAPKSEEWSRMQLGLWYAIVRQLRPQGVMGGGKPQGQKRCTNWYHAFHKKRRR